MKISFTDFWGDFNYNNNFFIYFIKKILANTDVILTDLENADIVIYSSFGQNHKTVNRKKTKKIFFTGENIRPNHSECDYSFTFDFDDYCGKNIRIPLWYLYIDWFDVKSYGNPQYLLPLNEMTGKWFLRKKNKKCCTVFSSPKPQRYSIISALSQYFSVDCYGKPFGNHSDGEEIKYNIISDYKINICFENSIYSGYVTEKLLHARTAGNLALYWGHNDVKYDFNKDGFINANEFNSFEECAEYVKYVIDNADKYNKIINTPIFNCNFFDFEERVKAIL